MKLAGAAAQKFISKPDDAIRAVLFYGPNRARISEATAALQLKYLGPKADDLALTRLLDEDLKRDPAKLADEMAAQSLLGGKRLVRLRIDNDSQAETIIAMLADLDRGAAVAAFLIVEAGDLAKKSKTRVAFEEAGASAAIAFYDEDAKDLAALAETLLREAKVSLDRAATEALFADLPGDRGQIRAEIEKLALFAHGLGRDLNEADIRALGIVSDSAELDAAGLAVAAGKGALAAEALHGLENSAGVSAIKALERRFLRMLEAKHLTLSGTPIADAGKRLKPPVFWKEADAFAGHVRAWSVEQMLAALDRIWAAEVASKSAQSPAALIAAQLYREVSALRA
ncbi:MAG: DNA polymerase III subunit delta [Caulobacterales bacterium]